MLTGALALATKESIMTEAKISAAILYLRNAGFSDEYIRKLGKDGEQGIVNAARDLGFTL